MAGYRVILIFLYITLPYLKTVIIASPNGGLTSIPGKHVWVLWQKMQHWERLFRKKLGFSYQVFFRQYFLFIRLNKDGQKTGMGVKYILCRGEERREGNRWVNLNIWNNLEILYINYQLDALIIIYS